MSLPIPNLDDRHFQDIVDEAKRMIPRYCPEWTDHNVSDPGVALIELFAWMTDMLLYRVNQVPDKMYVTFLEMIGVRLAAPRAARAPVTFYLSAAQPADVVIPRDTEVATVRTETSPAIIFASERDLAIRAIFPEHLLGAFTRNARRSGSGNWVPHDLRQLGLRGRTIAMFPPQPGPGDAFYIALEPDLSHHVLALLVDCELAGGAGIDPKNPPLEWQVWQGSLTRWARCTLEYDGTGGFNESGEIVLHVPAMAQEEFQGIRAHWMRCRLTEAQAGDGGYQASPELESLRLESRGGTVDVHHAVTVVNEIVGRSDGTPGQSFRLINTPLLARDPQLDHLIVEPLGLPAETWSEVTDFAASGPEDRHYTLDNLEGTLTLGPELLQPDGSVYRFGARPPTGSTLRFSRYQFGGGTTGNVPQGTIAVMKSSIPYVARVSNRQAAVGGRDAQSLADAKLRAPQVLRTRTRAMTADDYEHLAREVIGVARACSLAPGAQPGTQDDLKPGQVAVAVLPQVDAPHRRIAPEQLALPADLRGAVLMDLRDRCPLGITLDVRPAQLVWVSVQATLRVAEHSNEAFRVEVQRRAEAELYRYLNPHVGGPRGDGWPFGRDLHVSEIYSLLQRVPAVEFVEDIRLSVGEPGATSQTPANSARLSVPRAGVVCSDQHVVKVI